MAVNEIHLNDVGTRLGVTVKEGGSVVDISGATATKQIKLYKPSGTTVTKDADFTTDGTDGKMEYVTVADDLDEVGVWRIQGYLSFDGWTGHTDISEFEVFENL